MDTDNSSNKLLTQYGILAGVIAGIFVILAVSIIFSENVRHNGQKEAISSVLEEEEPGEWIIGDYVGIKAPVALSAACFQVRRKDNGAKGYVLMLRIETIYGPFPAVFVYNEKTDARFIGISGLHGRIREIIGNGSTDTRINFWVKRIPDIIKDAEVAEPADKGAGRK
jgi:hypothetical protein